MQSRIQAIILLFLLSRVQGLRFDETPSITSRPVQDRQLQDYIRTSCRWLQFRAVYNQYPLLNTYAEQLQLVLRTDCAHCVDYYEAAGLLGLLGKTVNQIIKDGKDDTHYPVVRRSYVAAVWLLQRSRQFVWETTHMPSTALSTLFRLYLGHVHRAKGRTVSLHHISKCGGTTMCQLAASNRCSNPHLSQEKNCVLNDRLDGPLWMVGHNVSPQGVMLNPAIGSLDKEPVSLPAEKLKLRRFANEPKMDMWLMYACPYTPNGRIYNCQARAADAHESGTTFLANERTLTREDGMAQVCSEFLNAVIFREPVPHAISIMAEVKYRYVRQMAVKHNIHNWQPTAWNLTWWEALGPALVGNYATRTLLGRESLCRSASNMGQQQLSDALDALLSFDMVMTLGRSQDIDLVITTLLGWPARNFSSQPGARVREVSVDLATKGEVAVGDSKASKGGTATSRHLLQQNDESDSSSPDSEVVPTHGRSLLAAMQRKGSMQQQHHGQQRGSRAQGGQHRQPQGTAKKAAGKQLGLLKKKLGARRQAARQVEGPKPGAAARNGVEGPHKAAGQHAAAPHPVAGPSHVLHSAVHPSAMSATQSIGATSGMSTSPLTPAPAGSGAAAAPVGGPAPEQPVAASGVVATLSPKQLEQQAAVMLVSTTWHERQAELLGVLDKAAVWALTGEPHILHTGERSKHGAHLVQVTFVNKQRQQVTETWHSFPRHTFAFLDTDIAKLEALTEMDTQVYRTADLMFNLDTVWIQAMLSNSHYRKKMKTVASTYTSCGFAGMIPVDPALLSATQGEAEA